MKRVAAILIAAFSLWLCGCVIGSKRQIAKATPPAPQPVAPTVPQAPPAPLSIPQTQVELPAPQPIDPAALATSQPAEAPPETPAKARPPRRAPPARSAEPAAATPPPVETAEPERPPIQDILPAETQKKLQESAQSHKRDVAQLLQQAQSRRLTRQQAGLVKRIEQFVKLSDGAEQSGNMREADEFAERALVLARELSSAR